MNNFGLYDKELRQGEYHPEVVAYYYKQWENFQMPFHQHKAVEIMYVISGKCAVEIDQSSFSLKKGDFILIDADVSHRLIVEEDSPCRMLNIEFIFVGKKGDFPSVKELVEGNRSMKVLLATERPFILLRDQNEVYLTLKSLVFELDEGDKDTKLMTQLLLSQLFIRIARIVEEGDNEPQQTDKYMKAALDYIRHHYDCDIQIKDIAASVNLHPGYFHRIFKSNMGCTVIEYLTSLRVEKAKMLLSHTDIPVIEISGYIGMNSQQYFSSIFKKITGKTPIEFRKSVESIKLNHTQ